jgi:nitroreductase
MTVEAKLGSVIGQRRSVRRYLPASIDRTIIDRMLFAATLAPAHNRQPWRFAVLDERSGKEALAAAMGLRLRQDRTGDGDNPQALRPMSPAPTRGSRKRPLYAVVLQVCVNPPASDRSF